MLYYTGLRIMILNLMAGKYYTISLPINNKKILEDWEFGYKEILEDWGFGLGGRILLRP
jgi:hypothetical protein